MGDGTGRSEKFKQGLAIERVICERDRLRRILADLLRSHDAHAPESERLWDRARQALKRR